jgi:hypothetical protein
MKKSQLLVSFLILFTVFACISPEPAIIEISEDMVINESGSGDMMAWFDEQDLDATPTTRWRTEGMTTFWPTGLVINLGRKYKITEVWIYDGPKENHVEGGQLILASGKPFKWENLKQVNIQNSNTWTKIDWATETQFIQLQKNATKQFNLNAEYPQNCDLAINEIILFGYPLEKKMPEKNQTEHVAFNIPMDQFIGMNSYIYTPDKVHEAIGCVREYRPWRWNGVTDLNTPISWDVLNNQGAQNEYAEKQLSNGDSYYQKMKNMGIECIPCIHRHVDEANEHENIPSFGGNPDDPLSYRIISDYSFQFVARYGSTKVEERLLRTTEKTPKKSGMGLIRYFENWNEPNRHWGNPAGHFTPYQFAAYCSASFDGHMNEMGEGFGVKNADPQIKFVHGGLAFLSIDYLKAMKLWSDHYRNGSFPADVINVHHYCNTRNTQHPDGYAHGISPEDDMLKEKLTTLVEWRNKYLPGKELWLSEFGWDTDENTYQSAAFGHSLYPHGISKEEIQAQWLTRAFLLGAAAGLDRMQMFLANDLKNYPHGVYGTCGFITVDEGYKPSWYYVKTLKNALAGMVFLDELPSEHEKVWIYRFKNLQSGKGAYVLWCPTSDGTTEENFSLKITGKTSSVQKITLTHKHDMGISEEIEVIDKIVKLNVSERPVILLVDSL